MTYLVNMENKLHIKKWDEFFPKSLSQLSDEKPYVSTQELNNLFEKGKPSFEAIFLPATNQTYTPPTNTLVI